MSQKAITMCSRCQWNKKLQIFTKQWRNRIIVHTPTFSFFLLLWFRHAKDHIKCKKKHIHAFIDLLWLSYSGPDINCWISKSFILIATILFNIYLLNISLLWIVCLPPITWSLSLGEGRNKEEEKNRKFSVQWCYSLANHQKPPISRTVPESVFTLGFFGGGGGRRIVTFVTSRGLPPG